MPSRRLIERLYVPTSEETTSSVWINDDIRPLPPSRRTWNKYAFISFWAINQIAISNWQLGSSLVATGLNVWQTVIAIMIGKVIIAGVAILNGFVGAEWHIGFPVFSRAVWGIYGSYIALLQRILLSLVWYSVQSWTGGLCMTAILSSIFSGFHTMENRFPDSTHMTTKQFTGWVIYNVVSIPMLYLPPDKTKRLFYVMNTISFFTLVGIMIWALSDAGGGGPLLSQSATVKSSTELGWSIVHGITTVVGSIAVGLTNQPDYSRFATKPGDQVFGQWFSIIAMGSLMPTFGCLASSATAAIYGEAIWNPPDIVLKWLETDYNPKSRAGAFFAGVGLVICQLAINTIDNAFATGMDLSGVFPKFINIRRGAYLGLIVSIAMCPWELLSSAATFINVLSAYSVFLGPICGIMVCEYWVIRQRKIKLTDLYHPRPDGAYYYWKGINLRAYSAWITGFASQLPGFINAINPSIEVPVGCVRLYSLAFPLGFVLSFLSYLAFNKLFPLSSVGEIDGQDVYGTFTHDEAIKRGITPREGESENGTAIDSGLKDDEDVEYVSQRENKS